jgi:uncharacterized RDD family membrane protein YckC
MNAKAEKAGDVNRTTPEQVIVNFDAARLKAPFLLRCGAFLIDYIVLVSIPVLGLLLGRAYGSDGTKLLNSEISNTGWLIMFLLALTNFVILPMFSGQSLGKMLTGLKILQKDGHPATFAQLLARHTVGYFLTAITLGLGFLPTIFGEKGRALHDLVSGTVVIYGRRRVAREISE